MKIKNIALLALLIPTWGITQVEEKKKEKRPTYIGFEYGISNSKFRDFATSPLFYTGKPMSLGISRTRLNAKREGKFSLTYLTGKFNSSVGQEVTQSSVKTLAFSYSKLYILPKFSNEKWNLKTGGKIYSTANLRSNQSLQNNATGIEIITSLMGSIKAERDISRTANKSKKFLFIKYNLKERKRKLSYKLNIGFINTSYRNGYNYSGQSSVLNTPKLFDDYQLSTFSGLNVGSELNYDIHLKNKNIIELSYNWNLYKTGGAFDQFELVNHHLKFTFLFNTK